MQTSIIETTVIIATIGRETLPWSIDSAVNEGFKVIVVGDGIQVSQDVQSKFPDVVFASTGRKYGNYGAIAHNLASYLATTEFVTELDDDDEFIRGRGSLIKDRINSQPNVDIWIPGLRFNNGDRACISHKRLEYGNVALPTFRTVIFASSPKRYVNKNEWHNVESGIDFYYVNEAVKKGFKIDWIGEEVISVRPKLEGKRGWSKNNSAVIVPMDKSLRFL